MEYIEREALLELYVDGKYDTADYHVPVPVIIQNIKDIPAADVRPVVRCKFCRSQRWCKFAQYLGNDGFCSQGEYVTNCVASMDKEVEHD